MEIILLIIILYLIFSLRKKEKKPVSSISLSEPTEQDLPSLDQPLPYRPKYILTKNEYAFYMTLKPLLDEHDLLACPKVGLKDMFEPLGQGKERMSNWGKISQKHIDFLICDNKLRPVFAIELDDSTHALPDAKAGDAFKNALFAQSKVPLYRVPAAMSYSKEYILPFLQALQPKETPSVQSDASL